MTEYLVGPAMSRVFVPYPDRSCAPLTVAIGGAEVLAAPVGVAQNSARHSGTVGCGRCSARWGGLKTAHCMSCHRTFTTAAGFDRHRAGSHVEGARHCVDPACVGLVDAGRAYPCWGFPGRDEAEGD